MLGWMDGCFWNLIEDRLASIWYWACKKKLTPLGTGHIIQVREQNKGSERQLAGGWSGEGLEPPPLRPRIVSLLEANNTNPIWCPLVWKQFASSFFFSQVDWIPDPQRGEIHSTDACFAIWSPPLLIVIWFWTLHFDYLPRVLHPTSFIWLSKNS